MSSYQVLLQSTNAFRSFSSTDILGSIVVPPEFHQCEQGAQTIFLGCVPGAKFLSFAFPMSTTNTECLELFWERRRFRSIGCKYWPWTHMDYCRWNSQESSNAASNPEEQSKNSEVTHSASWSFYCDAFFRMGWVHSKLLADFKWKVLPNPLDFVPNLSESRGTEMPDNFAYCATRNLIISSCTFQLSMNWSADHRPCWFLVCFLGVCWCCGLFLVFVCLPFCFARWQLNGLCIDPTQFPFVCTLSSWLMLPLH